MKDDTPTSAMVVIGDEILSGRTRDANMHHLAGVLTEAGAPLTEVRVVADDRAAIVAAVNELRARCTYVFTSGGIGPTHDDITAECVAEAFGVGIDVRDDAREILLAHYGDPDKLTPSRLRMARIPDGATLIANPVSGAPGFKIENVHVMAGVPLIFNAMVESVRPTLEGGAPMLSHAFRIPLAEGDIAGPLAELAAAHPDISFGSYPFYQGGYGATIVARSQDRDELAQAAQALRAMCKALGATDVTELPPI
ncbi:molybdopterin-binding protein [Albimonas sp. CAU 1670]|uniref:competence/damage-inducible protein A n=1 Tax=Albimonas sp. CAU 1670 TaxID=3032599 RepID=UPI0023DA3EDF|nr:molybdopterin-binding protein [Albimonas sp. CAU 1670]MDF2232715.1 molybdopterin-binding protein [Albimonas sp. CAU 1670]